MTTGCLVKDDSRYSLASEEILEYQRDKNYGDFESQSREKHLSSMVSCAA